MKSAHWKHIQKILCVRLDNMGDVLLTAPAIQALRQTFPSAHIALLTSPVGSTITPFLPMIDQTIIYDAPWMNFKNNSDNTLSLIAKLQKLHIDGGICFSNFSQNSMADALLLFLANIPKRLGYSRENLHQLLTDWIADPEPFTIIKHGVQRQLDLVKQIGATAQTTKISLTVFPHDIASVTQLLYERGLYKHLPLIVVHPGVSSSKRQFPLSILGPAVYQLTKKYQVVLTGTEKEISICQTIQHYAPLAVSLCNQLATGQLISLISLSSVLLSNNTGPAHIAAGVNTPVVVLYARTNPEHTPWHVPSKILYFDVEEKYETHNQILTLVKPREKMKLPTILDIVHAVESLVTINNRHALYA